MGCASNSLLDEELGLLAGEYTPQLQAMMVRLGSRMTFREAELHRPGLEKAQTVVAVNVNLTFNIILRAT